MGSVEHAGTREPQEKEQGRVRARHMHSCIKLWPTICAIILGIPSVALLLISSASSFKNLPTATKDLNSSCPAMQACVNSHGLSGMYVLFPTLLAWKHFTRCEFQQRNSLEEKDGTFFNFTKEIVSKKIGVWSLYAVDIESRDSFLRELCLWWSCLRGNCWKACGWSSQT